MIHTFCYQVEQEPKIPKVGEERVYLDGNPEERAFMALLRCMAQKPTQVFNLTGENDTIYFLDKNQDNTIFKITLM